MSASPPVEQQKAEDGDARDPSGFLSEIIGAPVIVKLNSGVVFKGALRLLFSLVVLVPFDTIVT